MKAVLLLSFSLAWASQITVVAETPENSSTTAPQAPVTQATIDKLLAVIAAHEARIEELEKKLEEPGSGGSPPPPRRLPRAPMPKTPFPRPLPTPRRRSRPIIWRPRRIRLREARAPWGATTWSFSAVRS